MEIKSLTIKALRGFYYDRKLVKAGDIVTVPRIFAIEVCASNKAELIEQPAQAAPAASAGPAMPEVKTEKKPKL